jgi:hypothetical protein
MILNLQPQPETEHGWWAALSGLELEIDRKKMDIMESPSDRESLNRKLSDLISLAQTYSYYQIRVCAMFNIIMPNQCPAGNDICASGEAIPRFIQESRKLNYSVIPEAPEGKIYWYDWRNGHIILEQNEKVEEGQSPFQDE